MMRKETLESALKCVCGEREQDYGTPEDSFGKISALWSVYTGYDYTPKDVALMMALLKIARAAHSNNVDNYVDLAGYAACAAEVESSYNPAVTD